MSKRVLITGSDGFIGSHLMDLLKSQGYDVTGVDRKNGHDLNDWEVVNNLDDDFDYVYHLAAFNGTKWFYDRPVDVIRDNFYPTENIFRKYSGKVKKIVFAGTCESYVGSTEHFNYPIPTDEGVPLCIDNPRNLRWSYGGSKLLNELMVWAYSSQYNQDFAIIRYHNIYGPGQVDHFIPEFVHRVNNGDYNLYGSNNTRSFMYIADACEITRRICESDVVNLLVHVGSGIEVSIKDVAEAICLLKGIDPQLIVHNDAPEGSAQRRCPDVKLMNEIVGELEITSMIDGLSRTIKSYE